MGSNFPSGSCNKIIWKKTNPSSYFCFITFILDIKSRSGDESNALIIQVREISMLDLTANLQSNLNMPFAVKLRFFSGFSFDWKPTIQCVASEIAF